MALCAYVRNSLVLPQGLLKEARHDFGSVDIFVHRGACCFESDRDFLRDYRPVRYVQVAETSWLDGALSRNPGVDERDRVLLSARSPVAVPYRRHPLAGRAGGRNPRALWLSARGILALDLCRRRWGGSLSQCLRRGRPSFPEAAVP